MEQIFVSLNGQQAPVIVETGTLGLAQKLLQDIQTDSGLAINAALAAEQARDEAVAATTTKANVTADNITGSTWRSALGLGGSATLNVGTTTGTVAAGDDARLVAVAGKTNVTGDNITPGPFRAALGFGDIISVLDYVTDPEDRAAILDGTTTTDATAWVEAAWDDLPNAGILDFGVNTTWRFTQDVILGGKSALIRASDATFIIAHSGIGVSVEQTAVDQYLEWEQPRYVADLSTGSVQACWAVSFPSVAGYGATNFKSRFGSALASTASGSSPWPNSFQRFGEVTGAWYSEIEGEVRGPAPASEAAGPRLDSAFLRIDRCYEMQVMPTATSYYVGRVIDQVSYCEGIRIAGTHVGCGQALYVNPSMTAGPGGYNGLALYLDGHIAAYSVGIDAWKWNGVRSATTLDLYRWGDSGADWTGFALRSTQSALISCNIECGPPLTGTRRGVHVTATDGFGADCVVLSAKIANADRDVEFGASTTRNSVIAPTPYAGEGANRFVDSGTGNVILRDPSAIASCTVAQLPTLGASSTGAARLCTNGYGGSPGIVVWNGTGWIRVDNGQAPATTGVGYVRVLKGSASADFPSIPNGGSNVSASSPLGITVTGARAGDGVTIGTNVETQGMSVSGYVISDDTVRVVLTNNTGGAINPGPIEFTAYVTKA